MKFRNAMIAGAAVLTMGATSAFAADNAARDKMGAQSTSAASKTSGTLTVIDNDDTMVQAYNINVGKLQGMDVVGAKGEDVGDVDDVLADTSGKPVAVSIDAGSFLKMNKKEIIMQLSDLTMRDGKLHTTMTKDQISALPDHDD